MSDQNIDIRINTQANTAGAKQAEQSMEELQASMRNLRTEAEETVRNSKAELAATQQAEEVASINRKVTAQVIAQTGQVATQAAGFLREFNRELAAVDPQTAKTVESIAQALDMVALGAQGAAIGAAIGGPIGAAIGGAVMPAVSATLGEIQNAILSQQQLNNLITETPIIAQRIAQVKRLYDMTEEIRSWQQLKEEVRLTNQETELIRKATATQNQAKVEKAEIDVQVARDTGGDVRAAEERLRAAQRAAFDSNQEQTLKAAIASKEQAVSDLQTAESQLLAMNRTYLTASAADQERLAKEMADLEKSIPALRDRLRQAEDQFFLTRQTQAFEGATQQRRNQAEDVSASQDQSVEQVRGIIDGLKSKGGGSKELQAVIAEAEKAISDGVLSAAELERLPLLFTQFSGQMQRLGQSVTAIEKVVSDMDDLNRRLRALEIRQQ